MKRKVVDVAVGVLFNSEGQFLLGQRADNTVYPGFWEFPGGKVEVGETPQQALCRELKEELDIEIIKLRPWLVRMHDYEHAKVQLHLYEVTEWKGEIKSIVHQELGWANGEEMGWTPMLPANGPILKALRLPRRMGITWASTIGVSRQLAALDKALLKGLRLIQVREAGLSVKDRYYFAHEVVTRAHAYGAIVLINNDLTLAKQVGADGVHLSAKHLMSLSGRPEFVWVGAACHHRDELKRAVEFELDYAVVSPVKPTLTHPERKALGWAGLAAFTAFCSIPVFALGGLREEDSVVAQEIGAHGIAAIRSIWEGLA